MEYKVHPTAIIDDNVKIGKGTSIWHFSHIQSGARIGEKCTLGQNVNVGNNVSIGHNAIVHGCTLSDNVLIGMGAIVMDGALVNSNTIVAAGAVVLEGTICEGGSIYAGVPARKVKDISGEMISGEIDRIANNYVRYANWFRNHPKIINEQS